MLAVVPDSGASGSGSGGDVWAGAVGREYRLDVAVLCVNGLGRERYAEIQWLIIILL